MDKRYCSSCLKHQSREGGFNVIRRGKVVRWRCRFCNKIAQANQSQEPNLETIVDKQVTPD